MKVKKVICLHGEICKLERHISHSVCACSTEDSRVLTLVLSMTAVVNNDTNLCYMLYNVI